METVSSNYPDFQYISDNVEHSISVYKISYLTKFNGDDIIASGLVAIPDTKDVIFPMLSYQNGTNTLHNNAPSVNPNYELYLLLEFVASTGFVVSIPDYLGFGESSEMFHPYLDRMSTVQTVTDMMRAVKELAKNYLEIDMNDDLYISGYSQGGWATMQLQKNIEENYMDEFNLKASACGAGPYDLNYINKYVLQQTNYPMPYFLGYMFNSYFNLGDITTAPADMFKAPYDERILTLYDGTKSGEEINAQLTTKVADLFTDDYIENFYTDSKFSSVVKSLTDNSIEAWKTTIPMLISHGTNDDFVPPLGSNKIFQDFLSKGVAADKIFLLPLTGATHTTGIIPSGIASVKWFIELKNEN
jgi:dienelactone hydrolase